MSSTSDMWGHVLNSQTMEITDGKEKENSPCLSRATPYLLSVLSIMVCLLAAAVCYFHLSTVQMETEMETMRQSLAQVRGRQGEKGEKGESGLPGFTGNKGQRGRPGSLGLSGLDGVPGDNGTPGLKGSTGDIGPIGPEGIKGEQGERGEKGEKGETGKAGSQGEQGIIGVKGEKGETGPEGPMNEKIFNDTEIEVQGPPGPKGERGPSGEKGEKGDPLMLADPFGRKKEIPIISVNHDYYKFGHMRRGRKEIVLISKLSASQNAKTWRSQSNTRLEMWTCMEKLGLPPALCELIL